MKTLKLFAVAVLTLVASSSFAQSFVWQDGYFRSNGTFVTGHFKTVSNGTNWDNFSTWGGQYYINSNGNKVYVPKR